MLIRPIRNYTPSFGIITLNDNERKKSEELLEKISKNPEPEKYKAELFELYKPHIENESKKRINPLFDSPEDFKQDLYLRLFDKCTTSNKDNIATSTDEILNTLNSKTNNKDVHIRTHKSSLDRLVSEKTKLSDLIPNTQTLKPRSALNNQEQYVLEKTIKEKLKKTKTLLEKEKQILELQAKGYTYNEIRESLKNKIAQHAPIQHIKNRAIRKIQKAYDILPAEYTELAKILKEKYKLEQSVSELEDILIFSTEKMSLGKDEILDRIDKSAELLGIENERFAKISIKNPILLAKVPETINKKVEGIADILEISKAECIDIAEQHINVFTNDTENIRTNLNDHQKTLNLSKDEILKLARKNFTFATLSKEKFNQYINGCAKILSIEPEAYIRLCVKNSKLLDTSPKTLKKRFNEVSKFGIDEKTFSSIILKAPEVATLSTKTINQRISDGSNLFNITREEYIALSKKHPALLYQLTDTIKSNCEKSAELLKISTEDFIKLGQKHPVIFSLKPKTLSEKFEIMRYFRQIRREKSNEVSIYTDSNDVLYKKILKYLVKQHDKIPATRKSCDLITYLKEKLNLNPETKYKLKIPQHNLAENLINYSQEFSTKNFGKQIFEFVVLNAKKYLSTK